MIVTMRRIVGPLSKRTPPKATRPPLVLLLAVSNRRARKRKRRMQSKWRRKVTVRMMMRNRRRRLKGRITVLVTLKVNMCCEQVGVIAYVTGNFILRSWWTCFICQTNIICCLPNFSAANTNMSTYTKFPQIKYGVKFYFLI